MTEIGGAAFETPQRGNEGTAWFAVQTRPRHEKKLASELDYKGMEVFLPLFSTVHQWSDRSRRVQLPLFASYLFVRLGEERNARAEVLRSPGALRFVGMRGAGVSVPDEQIQAIATLLREKVAFSPCPFLNVGQRVRIRGGSLHGIHGILTVNDGHCLVVSVEGIQRSLAVRIDGYGVDPV